MSNHFRSIGVCVDDSDAARTALGAAREIAAPDAIVNLVHVVEQRSFLVELAIGIGGGVANDTDALMETAQAWLESLADEGEQVVVLTGHPAEAIADWARDSGCDLLVMATHRGHHERTLLGSFSQRLSAAAPCSTLLVHPTHGG